MKKVTIYFLIFPGKPTALIEMKNKKDRVESQTEKRRINRIAGIFKPPRVRKINFQLKYLHTVNGRRVFA